MITVGTTHVQGSCSRKPAGVPNARHMEKNKCCISVGSKTGKLPYPIQRLRLSIKYGNGKKNPHRLDVFEPMHIVFSNDLTYPKNGDKRGEVFPVSSRQKKEETMPV